MWARWTIVRLAVILLPPMVAGVIGGVVASVTEEDPEWFAQLYTAAGLFGVSVPAATLFAWYDWRLRRRERSRQVDD